MAFSSPGIRHTIGSITVLLGSTWLLLVLSCSGGLQTLKGEDQEFVTPEFWDTAESRFGDQGGWWWLKEKINSIREITEQFPPFPPLIKFLLAHYFDYPCWPVCPPLMPIPQDIEEQVSRLLNLA